MIVMCRISYDAHTPAITPCLYARWLTIWHRIRNA